MKENVDWIFAIDRDESSVILYQRARLSQVLFYYFSVEQENKGDHAWNIIVIEVIFIIQSSLLIVQSKQIISMIK